MEDENLKVKEPRRPKKPKPRLGYCIGEGLSVVSVEVTDHLDLGLVRAGRRRG